MSERYVWRCLYTLLKLAEMGAHKRKAKISTEYLATKLGIVQQTASRYLIDLEKKGWIKRTITPEGSLIEITESGYNELKKLYSKLPAMNVMFTVLSERDDMFWLSPGRCNRFTYEQRGIKGHNNCQEILAELIKPYEMTAFDVPEVLNIFMNAVYQKDGTYKFIPAAKEKGDYVDLLANMDCLVGISACPGSGSYNDFQAKPIGVQILE